LEARGVNITPLKKQLRQGSTGKDKEFERNNTSETYIDDQRRDDHQEKLAPRINNIRIIRLPTNTAEIDETLLHLE